MRAIHDKQVENAVAAEIDHYAAEATKIEAQQAATKAMRQRGAMLVCAMVALPGLACMLLRYMARIGDGMPSVEMGGVKYKEVESGESATAVGSAAEAGDGSEQSDQQRFGGYQDVDQADLPAV